MGKIISTFLNCLNYATTWPILINYISLDRFKGKTWQNNTKISKDTFFFNNLNCAWRRHKEKKTGQVRVGLAHEAFHSIPCLGSVSEFFKINFFRHRLDMFGAVKGRPIDVMHNTSRGKLALGAVRGQGRFSLVPHCIKIILIQCGTRPKTSGTKVGTPPSPEPLAHLKYIFISFLHWTKPKLCHSHDRETHVFACRTTGKLHQGWFRPRFALNVLRSIQMANSRNFLRRTSH